MKKCNEVPLSQNMLGILPSPQYMPSWCYPNQKLAHKILMYFVLPFFKFVAIRYIHRCPEYRSCHEMSRRMR